MLGPCIHSSRYNDASSCALVAVSLTHGRLPLIFPVACHG